MFLRNGKSFKALLAAALCAAICACAVGLALIFAPSREAFAADEAAEEKVKIVWRYSKNASSTNASDWKEIENGKLELNYSYQTEDLRTNIKVNVTVGDKAYGAEPATSGNISVTKDGKKVEAIKDAGVYTVSLTNWPDLKDFDFSPYTVTVTVKPMEIELNNEENFYWLFADYGSELLSGYVDENFQYYDDEASNAADGRTHVKSSVVRDRNYNVGIYLFGAREAEGAYSIEYGDGCDAEGLGKYIANAKLTLNTPNYVFKCTGNLDPDRHMTVKINDDGTVDVTKEWYIAKVDNGLKSQQQGDTYGKEWKISGWTYGSYKAQYAPRLEHGDPGEPYETIPFAEDNDLVTFRLFRIETEEQSTEVQMGETFNRYAFNDYINESLPAGTYLLEVSADSYTSQSHVHWYDGTPHDNELVGIYYDSFTNSFIFTVAEAQFGTTNIDELADKTYTYTYDGTMHLFSGFTLRADVFEAPRTGEWAKPEYDGYYGGAELHYNLVRWTTNAFLTETGLNAYNNESQKPQGVGTYTVYYKLFAPGYKAVGGTKYFTVVINKASYDMSGVTYGDLQATYDGEYKSVSVSGLPAGVTYKADEKVNAGTHEVTVRFFGDELNYEPIPDGKVSLVISKAKVEIPEDRRALLDGESYTYAPSSDLCEVVGDATFTQAGDYIVTLRLIDNDNYEWDTEDGNPVTTVNVKLSLIVAAEEGGNKGSGCNSAIEGVSVLVFVLAGGVALAGVQLLKKRRK